jgi:DNA (cytosine-5)-methyltransferase 1
MRVARTLNAADLFCGAGGTSIGAEQSGAAKVRFAVNHWDVAVQTHSANFPDAQHVNSRLDEVKPGECPKIDLLFASPECIHHSRARGGKPTSDQQRSGAWQIMPWIEHHRPSFVIVENVTEFEQWGPVGENGKPLQRFKGRFFTAWVNAIESAGYRVEWGKFNAADFGAATSRERLFVIARKGGRAVHFPDPTHARHPGRALPGMQLAPWRAAAEIIDWSLPCPSIFSRTRPLADKTLARIEAGLRRFVEPFVVRLRNHGDAASLSSPLGTVTAGGMHHGVAVPFQYQLIGLGAGRSRSVDDPVPTMVASRENHGVAVPYITRVAHGESRWGHGTHGLHETLGTQSTSKDFALAVPFMANVNHGDARFGETSDTLGTITGKNGRAIVFPFLSSYYGNGDAVSVHSPCPTIVTKDRHSLLLAHIDPACLSWPAPHSDAMRSLQSTMRELGVADIGFRMLQNHELSDAQGFPSTYIFRGNKSQVTRQIGNSVSPPVARALTEAVAA